LPKYPKHLIVIRINSINSLVDRLTDLLLNNVSGPLLARRVTISQKMTLFRLTLKGISHANQSTSSL
jgi:hypothetical protein